MAPASVEHDVEPSAAFKRWERLVGRCCAAIAWKRLQLLLYWVHQSLLFSEGCEERGSWLSEKVGGRDANICSFAEAHMALTGTLHVLAEQVYDTSQQDSCNVSCVLEHT